MAIGTDIPEMVGEWFGILSEYDEDRVITVEKAVDVTAFCPKVKFRAVFKYGKAHDGPNVDIVDISDPKTGYGPIGTAFFYEAEGLVGLTKKKLLQEFAKRWGFKPIDLAQLILDNAPAD